MVNFEYGQLRGSNKTQPEIGLTVHTAYHILLVRSAKVVYITVLFNNCW